MESTEFEGRFFQGSQAVAQLKRVTVFHSMRAGCLSSPHVLVTTYSANENCFSDLSTAELIRALAIAA